MNEKVNLPLESSRFDTNDTKLQVWPETHGTPKVDTCGSVESVPGVGHDEVLDDI